MSRFTVVCAALVSLAATVSLADTVYVTSFTTGEIISYDSTDPAGTRTVRAPVRFGAPASKADRSKTRSSLRRPTVASNSATRRKRAGVVELVSMA